jgi:hypothetical protein
MAWPVKISEFILASCSLDKNCKSMKGNIFQTNFSLSRFYPTPNICKKLPIVLAMKKRSNKAGVSEKS